ncbi:PTS system fructose-specific EIIABC component [Planctomycetales bacterium 10988]|nr:PTS system fructose-specific EIIABC component [Planctomycetales bacterium 10988]
MKFADFICPEAVKANLTSSSKEDVIREMATSLLEAGQIDEDQFESIVSAILAREELGSTGIGRGVAVPHTKHASVDRLVGTCAVSHEGIDFAALDGETVHLFFLLISHPDRSVDHLRALESITRQLRNETFCRFLKQAKTEDEIRQLLEESDANQLG